MKKLFLIALPLLALLSSCDDKIDLDLNTSNPYLNVDADIDNLVSTRDTVRVSTTVGYLNQGKLPPVKGAFVVLSGSEGTLDTLEEVKDGAYVVNQGWAGQPGQTYTLAIKLTDGTQFQAAAKMPRVQILDSVTARYKRDEFPYKDGYYIGIWYTENPGKGDYTLFELTKNDTLQNLPQNLFVIIDDLSDGVRVQGPILNNDPYKTGDTASVRVCNLTEDAYYFYNELQVQLNNGGLFSQPPANVRTNIVNVTPGSEMKTTGYFLVRAKSEKGIRCK